MKGIVAVLEGSWTVQRDVTGDILFSIFWYVVVLP